MGALEYIASAVLAFGVTVGLVVLALEQARTRHDAVLQECRAGAILRFPQAARSYQDEATESFLRFGEGTVGDVDLAPAHADRPGFFSAIAEPRRQ